MMPLSEIIVFGLLAYFLYRLVFEFFLPIFRTTRKMHRHFRDFRDNMNGGSNRQAEPDGTRADQPPKDNRSGKPHNPSYDSIGEYIDFEEVKK